MHKRLYLILTILICILSVWCALSSLGITAPVLNSSFPLYFFVANALSIIILIVCSSNLRKNNESKINKIIPIIVLVCMVATIINCHVAIVVRFR